MLSTAQTIKEFEDEIEAVQSGIIRWLHQNERQSHFLAERWKVMYQTQDIEIAADIMQACEEITWYEMGASNWLGEDYFMSDIFQCAFAGAMDKIIQPST